MPHNISCYTRHHDPSHLRVQRFGGEFVPPLSLLIIKQHHSVNSANSELCVVWCPGSACHFSRTLL